MLWDLEGWRAALTSVWSCWGEPGRLLGVPQVVGSRRCGGALWSLPHGWHLVEPIRAPGPQGWAEGLVLGPMLPW